MLKQLDWQNTEVAFRLRSTSSLKKALWIFRFLGFPTLARVGARLASLGVRTAWSPVRPLVRLSVFEIFCGGETVQDCESTVRALEGCGVSSILDYSVEALQREDDFERSKREVLNVLHKAQSDSALRYAVFKVTALGRNALLHKLSTGTPLTPDEQAEERRLATRLGSLCAAAEAQGTRIMIDAEESWLQPAIDRYALAMMRLHNHKFPCVYQTVQMYRRDRLTYLDDLLALAASEGFHPAIKLVRGAYMEQEREQAHKDGRPSPIHDDKEATDKAFDNAIVRLVGAIRSGRGALCCGTHNERSTALLAELITGHDQDQMRQVIDFAQLYGMSDHLTFNLAAAGFRAAKYLPYGPIDGVFPYLARRAEENTSVGGQAGRELQLISRELKRRAQTH